MSVSKGIDAEFLRALKQKNDIIEVVRSYVALDKKGGTHWACCPFHHERTPSFAVNEGEQFYHCFGCGVSGDVVRFVQEIESTDFIGAVRILAARAKMEVPEGNFDNERALQMKKKRDNLAKIMLESARFYLSNLYSGDERAEAHLQYIAGRKLSPTTVKKFGLGASLDFYGLPDFLAGKGFSRQDLLDSGVLQESKSGRLIDSQGGRLIFPIINAFDEVVAFGGRILEKKDFAKYKNTKETILFNKSKILYNINLLKKLKRQQTIPNVIFVEGYMDTISLYQAGFENVVASMGTALTKEQARLVKRYSDNVLISYDGDFAGQKNTIRGLEILKEEGLNVRVVPLPEGADPDDVVKQGKDVYQKCLDDAMPLIDFKIHYAEQKYDLSDTSDKRNFLGEALKIIAEAESESIKEELVKKISNKLGVTKQALERDLEKVKKGSDEQVQVTAIAKPRIIETDAETDKSVKAKRFILAAKLFSSPYAKSFNLRELDFSDETQNAVAEYVCEQEEQGAKIRPVELFDVFGEDSPEFNKILDFNYGDKLTGETAEKFFADSVNSIKREQLETEIDKCNRLIANLTDLEERRKITKRIVELVSELNRLKRF